MSKPLLGLVGRVEFNRGPHTGGAISVSVEEINPWVPGYVGVFVRGGGDLMTLDPCEARTLAALLQEAEFRIHRG